MTEQDLAAARRTAAELLLTLEHEAGVPAAESLINRPQLAALRRALDLPADLPSWLAQCGAPFVDGITCTLAAGHLGYHSWAPRAADRMPHPDMPAGKPWPPALEVVENVTTECRASDNNGPELVGPTLWYCSLPTGHDGAHEARVTGHTLHTWPA